MVSYKCSIIANPEGNAWSFALEVYKRLRVRNKKYELNEVSVKVFRDGEIKPKIKDNVRRKNCFFIHDSSLEPAEWFLQLALINEALRNSSSQEISDVLPYLRFTRQDRKDESRVPVSSRMVADVVSFYADRLLTLDVHNPSISGFYSVPFDNLYSFKTVVKYLKKKHKEFLENVVIMSPDAGGAARAQSFARRINIEEIAVGYKTRKKAGEVSDLKITGDVKGKNVLIVDDILDSGNTLIKAYNSAKKAGADKIGAYCTHGLFTEGVKKMGCLDLLVVGDSFPNPALKETKAEVVSFAPLFAEAIYRINKGESLSALFD